IEAQMKSRNKVMRTPNENKMSDGGQERASLGVEVRKSSQEWSVQRSAVRSIAWLGLFTFVDILNHPIAQLRRVIEIRVELFRLSTAPRRGTISGTNLPNGDCDISLWKFDVHWPRVRIRMRVHPADVHRRRELHADRAVGRLRDLKDRDIQLERRISHKM